MRFKRLISNHAGDLAILLGLHGFAFAAGIGARKLSHSDDQKIQPSNTVNALLISNATLLGGGIGLLLGFGRIFLAINPFIWIKAPQYADKILEKPLPRVLLAPTAVGALIANSVLFAAKKGYEFEFKSNKQDADRHVNSLN